MTEFWDRYGKVILNFLLVGFICFAIYIFFTHIIPFFLPFFVGLLIATVNAPFIKLFEKNLKMKRKIAVAISMFLTISLLAIILIFSVINIYNELIKLQNNISFYFNNTFSNLQIYYDTIMAYYQHLPVNITDTINSNLISLKTKSEGLLGSVIDGMLNTFKSIPRIIIFLVVSLLSAFFINSDSRRIKVFFSKQLSRNFITSWDGLKTDALNALVAYIKAVLILMSVTFLEVTIGLLIIGADYAILMGIIIGLSEAIPIFGTGMVMVPWILWNLIVGDNFMAVSLSVIFILGVILRHTLEPKIIGDKMGLHPLATLMAMYIGMEVFGFLGLFVGPFSLIILRSIQKSGLVRVWKE